jgi:hypothetical protein
MDWEPIKDARTARWPGTMAQLLKMGAGTAVLLSVSRWLIEIRQSQTPCCGRRGEMDVAPSAFDDQKVDCHTPRPERDVYEYLVADDRRGKQKCQCWLYELSKA